METVLTYAVLGGIAYVLLGRLNNSRHVTREPEVYKRPDKGMSKKGVYDDFKNPQSTSQAGLQNPTLQPGGDLREMIAKMSFDAAEGDPKAQRWLVDHNIKNGLHVGGTGVTAHLGIGAYDNSHLVAG
jgi:hypothetical protein